jgi:hypothetical protein
LIARQEIRRQVPIPIDLMALSFLPSSEEARKYAPTLAEHLPGHRIAFVAPAGGPFGVARTVEQLSEFHGVGVASTFTDMDQALHWLKDGSNASGAA